MVKALSVRVCKVCSSLCRSNARVMAESSALLIVCRSYWDFISMWKVIPVVGSTMAAPSVGFPVFFYPSVYMKLLGSHAAWNLLGVRGFGVCGGCGGYGYCSV